MCGNCRGSYSPASQTAPGRPRAPEVIAGDVIGVPGLGSGMGPSSPFYFMSCVSGSEWCFKEV